MKYVSRDGLLWVEKDRTSAIVGLTRQYIKKLGMFVVYAPVVGQGDEVKQGDCLAALETCNGLSTLRCPIDGTVRVMDIASMHEPHSISDTSGLFIFTDVNMDMSIFVEEGV